VIAAGSLLDFALAEHDFSMPVGRIEYLFMGPMTWEESVTAQEESGLLEYLKQYSLRDPLPDPVHRKCLDLTKRFILAGGMPRAVLANRESSYTAVRFEQDIITQTFLDDFGKYKARVNVDRLRRVFTTIPRLIGQKTKYVNISAHEKARELSAAIELLSMARIVYQVCHSDANAVPPDAEARHTIFKCLFLDVGLVLSVLKTDPTELAAADRIDMANAGALAEQFVG
jgi:hypothetical protein